METYNNKIKPWLGIIAIIAIGLLMIFQPDAVADGSTSGRRGLIKMVLIWVWGIPAGIICLLIGLFLGYAQINGGEEEEEV